MKLKLVFLATVIVMTSVMAYVIWIVFGSTAAVLGSVCTSVVWASALALTYLTLDSQPDLGESCTNQST